MDIVRRTTVCYAIILPLFRHHEILIIAICTKQPRIVYHACGRTRAPRFCGRTVRAFSPVTEEGTVGRPPKFVFTIPYVYPQKHDVQLEKSVFDFNEYWFGVTPTRFVQFARALCLASRRLFDSTTTILDIWQSLLWPEFVWASQCHQFYWRTRGKKTTRRVLKAERSCLKNMTILDLDDKLRFKNWYYNFERVVEVYVFRTSPRSRCNDDRSKRFYMSGKPATESWLKTILTRNVFSALTFKITVKCLIWIENKSTKIEREFGDPYKTWTASDQFAKIF